MNRTIDDAQLFDPLTGAKIDYTSGNLTGLWRLGSDCPDCSLKPDSKALMNGTWHYARTNVTGSNIPSFSLTFPGKSTADVYAVLRETISNRPHSVTGTAVYVYGVAFSAATPGGMTFAVTNLSFTLDGQPSGPNYYADPLPGPVNPARFKYNILVYANTGLKNVTHVLQVNLEHNPTNHTAFLFDYAQYTYVICPSDFLIEGDAIPKVGIYSFKYLFPRHA
jgi:hypothetical protein